VKLDCIVVGTGGIGSAALYHLARRGARVMGIDPFPPGHDRGSSHGQTRMIRLAYFEHPDYVPLLRRSYDLWSELEAQHDTALYRETGVIQIGPPDGEVLSGVRRAAREHDLELQDVDSYTGLAWPEAAATMEAKARVYVNHLALDGGDGEDTDSEEALSERLGHVVEGIDTEETVPREEDLILPEQERLLTANRAAGWFTLGEGNVHTDNLVAIYDGRLIEIRGSVDLAGHLQVEMGKLFNGGRMIPFRLDCRLGEERCRPTPDLKEMGKSAAAELTTGLRQLSEAAQGVYRDLPF
jgi:glycine/D-amino acid oxidase-like deaminating enzyme